MARRSHHHFVRACTILILAALALHSIEGAEPARSVNDVRAFGAIGDGVADDTLAIQRAVDAGIGDLHFSKGVYRLTKSIVIDLDKVGYVSLRGQGVARIVMAGAGPAFQFLGTHQKSADPEGFADQVWDRQRMPLVDGIAIVGEHSEADGISAIGTMQLTITRLHARKLRHCVHLSGNNRNVSIADCHFYENRGCGVLYDQVNLHQSTITGCHISYNVGGGIVSRGGNVRNLHITGCDIESNMAPDVPATANVLIDSAGSVYGTGEVAITGCTIQHNNPSPDSANIRIIGQSTPTKNVPIVREGNITITGNVLSDVQVNIHLRECRGVAITGNTLWQGYRHNLLMEDCTAVVVSANNLDRNPRYDYGNTQEAHNGVVFRRCDDCVMTGMLVTNVWREPAGLILENCRRCSVSQCTVLECDEIGLLLKESVLCRVADCLIRDDRPGANSRSLVVTGGRGNVIANNVLGSPPETSGRELVVRNNDLVPPSKP